MKILPLSYFLLFFTQLSFSQFEYGIKGGLNFDSSGDIVVVADQLQKEGFLNGKIGYHMGIYSEVDFLVFYLRPELQYTRVSSHYENQFIDTSRIDLPISFGLVLVGSGEFFSGAHCTY